MHWKNHLKNRANRWIARRIHRQRGPIAVDRRRLYILPTRAGIVFALLLFAMLLGALNYSNSMAFMLTFLLTGMGLVSMYHTHHNLLNLQVSAGRPQSAFAGQHAAFEILVHNPTIHARYSLHTDHGRPALIDLAGEETSKLYPNIPAPRRGRLAAPRFKMTTEFPLGVFQAWTWLELDMDCLVYPHPDNTRPLCRTPAGQERGRPVRQAGSGDFVGLRPYRRGDPPRHIHWRATPRAQQLMVREFADPEGGTLWLDWDALPGFGTEARLSCLCHWVLEAQATGRNFGLALPGRRIFPSAGEAHKHRCLEALALFRAPGSAAP